MAPDSLFLQTEGFPAISSDGGTLLVVSDVYSCCLDLGAEMVRFRTGSRRPPDRLRIRREEPGRNLTAQDSLELRRWTLATHRKTQVWLEGQDWASMVPVDWRMALAKDSLLDPPLRSGGKVFPTWKSFQKALPKVKVPCFDPEEPERRCEGPASIQKVWRHPDLPWILVEFGHISGGSQLDDGPFWELLRR